MTNGWVDIKNADVILAMGGNPAENHPVGFKWFMEAKKTRGAKLVAVDPRFTRTAAVADLYAPIRPGTDIAFLLGIIRYAIEKKRYHEDYVKLHTNGPYIVGEKFAFNDGLFSGFDEAKGEYAKDNWAYEADPKTTAYERRPDDGEPALRLPAPEGARRSLHARKWSSGSAARRRRRSSKVAEIVTSTGNARAGRHDHLRARLDAALDRRADDPRRRRCCSSCSGTSAGRAAA